jgi:NADH-quinone oxidoreductase subunit D
MPYTDRLDYFCSLTNNWAYALAVEKLAGLQVPERAEYIRVITAELTRLQNHACLAGFLTQDMGASGTPLMYAFREREKILDLFESLTGARMMCNYMRFGGCRCDLPVGWLAQAKKVVAETPRFIDEFENLLAGNEILMARTQGIGKLSGELAINAGYHRTAVARGGRQLRSPQGGQIRHLRPLPVQSAAGRSWRHV